MTFLFQSDSERGRIFAAECARELPDLRVAMRTDEIDPEPLPQDHALWSHPKVILTPHVPSVTQPQSAAHAVIENIHRHEAGFAPVGLVDFDRGF